MLYKNEAALKTDVINYYVKRKFFVTPIQTRTVVGVPDLYIAGEVADFWIECKHTTQDYKENHTRTYKVRFEPGQQAWAMKYHAITGKSVDCIIAFANGVYTFPLGIQLYKDGRVPAEVFIPFQL